jgi:hypothetical protein
MFRPSRLQILSLLLPVLLFACSAEEGGGTSGSFTATGVAAATAPKDELSLLCPEGALVFIRFNDLAGLEEEVYNLVRTADPDDEGVVLLTELIGRTFMNPGMEGVDQTRPLGLALLDSERGEPLPVFIIPISSEQEFRTVLEADPNWSAMQQAVGLSFPGKWAAFAMDPAMAGVVTMRKEPVPLATEMLEGDVSMAVDLVALNELVAPQFAQMEAEQADMPPGMEMYQGMMTGMLDGVKGFLSDSATMKMSATMRDGDVSLTVSYGARPGSPMGKKLAEATPKKPELIHSLGTAGLFAAEFHMSMEGLWDFYAPMYEIMFAEDPELLATMEKAFTMMDGGAVGMSIRNGMKMVALSHLTDPEAYGEYSREMMSRMNEFMEAMKESPGMAEMPVNFEVLPAWKHGDVEVTGMNIGMDFSGIPDVPPQMSMFMDQFFGPEGLSMQTCYVGELGISVAGDEDMKAVIDRVKAGETKALPQAFANATAGFPETVNGIFYLNLAEIAPWIGDMAKDELSLAQQGLLRNPPPDLWCAGYVRTEGPTVTFGMRMKVLQMVKYVSAIEASE